MVLHGLSDERLALAAVEMPQLRVAVNLLKGGQPYGGGLADYLRP